MRTFVLAAIGLILAGCTAASPAPNFINGYYYMAGDANCLNARNIGPTRIACMNARGQATGYRDAMTAQQIQMYQFQAMQQQMQMRQMQQTIDNNNAMLAATTQATLNQAAMYTPPVVQPVRSYDQNQIRCIGVGIYTNCRW